MKQTNKNAGLARNIFAGVTLAAAAIPIDMGYTKIAGMPIVSGLYILLLPTVAFRVCYIRNTVKTLNPHGIRENKKII